MDYYIRKGDLEGNVGDWELEPNAVEVIIPGFEAFPLFAHRTRDHFWVVSDAQVGMRLPIQSLCQTQAEAVAEANKLFQRITPNSYRLIVRNIIKKWGKAPTAELPQIAETPKEAEAVGESANGDI